MTVTETQNPSSLKIKLDCGLDDKGKTIVKSRTYSNVKHDANAQNVIDVANTMVKLCEHSPLEIAKQDYTILN